MKIIWSPLAIQRVQEIADYIAYDKPPAAIQWVESVFDAAEKLQQHPQFGRQLPELQNPNYREIIHGNYRIIYRLEEKRILILTVRHGSQILPREDLGQE